MGTLQKGQGMLCLGRRPRGAVKLQELDPNLGLPILGQGEAGSRFSTTSSPHLLTSMCARDATLP